MAPHSSPLAWKIPWTEEPGRLQSMRLRRVRHNWVTSLSLFPFMHWSRKWQPIPVFLPGEAQGRGSLVGCHLWGRTESDRTEATHHQQQQQQCIYVNPNLLIYLFLLHLATISLISRYVSLFCKKKKVNLYNFNHFYWLHSIPLSGFATIYLTSLPSLDT